MVLLAWLRFASGVVVTATILTTVGTFFNFVFIFRRSTPVSGCVSATVGFSIIVVGVTGKCIERSRWMFGVEIADVMLDFGIQTL